MKLLAVEPRQWGTYQVPRYEKAERLGHQVYLLAGEGGDPSTWPAERYRMLGSKRLPDLIEAARAWHAEEGFDAVFTFSEMAVILVAHIARALGLPGSDPQAALTSRNKLLMRQAHERGGVPHPRFRFVTTVDEALAAADEFGYPAIIKPTLGGASAFVFRVDTPEELRLRFQQSADGISDPKFYTYMEADQMELGPNGLLIESFLDGHEHLIEATVWDGEVFLGSVVDRVTVEGKVFDDDVHHAPTSLPQADYDKLYQVAAAGVRSQGLQRSVAHVEIRFHQGEPYVLEIAARPGGGGLDDMARAIGGHDPIRAVVDIARGIKPDLHHWKPTGVHMSGVAMICPAGVVEEVIVPPDLPTRPDIGFFRIVVKPGDVIRRPPDGNTVFGFLGVTGTSFEDVFRKTNEYMAEIEVKLVGKSEAVGSAPV